jgi:glyoxylase-like metal-dependent hydrolase (beta-lactamase superfamily II)
MQMIERDWLSSNMVIFDGAAGTCAVDTGYHAHRAMTVALVARALGDKPLQRVVCTHLHADHCGGNRVLAQRYGCPITVATSMLDAVAQWDQERLMHAPLAQECERFEAADGLAHGQTARLGDIEWQVIASPGHDNDSFMLYASRERILISADALWEHGFGVIFPELNGDPGFALQRQSLQAIDALDIALVIPGHGPMFTDARGALARARSRLDYLSADPKRNARLSIKVLLKFLLLERRRVSIAEYMASLETTALMQRVRTLLPGESTEATAEAAIEDLVRVGAARRDAQWLLNA